MISVILYGRNDNYGYNLHKRAALSLNCIAAILSDPTDEILFVDYNTPDDYPTFPEAILDTLSAAAKARLRILRVRPTLHRRFRDKSHLVALEPVARNIAVRRSNHANRWILSTNTDMIFVPHTDRSLSDIAAELPRGFYHLPRCEIPETLWETFDRKDAHGTIQAIRHWSKYAHLNEIVTGIPVIRFDAPGDFQLIEREDLHRLHGFDEAMLLGWHVDSNMAKRLHLLHGATGDLSSKLLGYHCDHTRQVTPAHRNDSVSNDHVAFVDRVVCAEAREQEASWGCPDDEIEEFRLSDAPGSAYLRALRSVIREEMQQPTVADYLPGSFDSETYDPRHILPFLADIFVSAPPSVRLAWIGQGENLLSLFAELWHDLGREPLLVCDDRAAEFGQSSDLVRISSPEEIAETADAIVFAYDPSNQTAASGTMASFVKLVLAEQARIAAGEDPRRFVGVNAIHTRFERLFAEFVGATKTPFSTRIRHGFVRPRPWTEGRPYKESWLQRMFVGTAGTKVGTDIWSSKDMAGFIAYGPYARLFPGRYRVHMEFVTLGSNGSEAGSAALTSLHRQREILRGLVLSTKESLRRYRAKKPRRSHIFAEVVDTERQLAAVPILNCNFGSRDVSLEFDVHEEDLVSSAATGIEVRVWTSGRYVFGIKSVMVSRVGNSSG